MYLCLLTVTGVGALYIRRRPRVRVEPIQSGGGQERYRKPQSKLIIKIIIIIIITLFKCRMCLALLC